MRWLLLAVWMLGPVATAWTQYWNGQDSLYGYEWIAADQTYYRIDIQTEGLYRFSLGNLPDFPFGEVKGEELRLFFLGQEVPIAVSQSGTLSSVDEVVFFARALESRFDRYLFQNPETDMLNPGYSLFTDEAPYFLTWTTDSPSSLRYLDLPNDLANPPSAIPWCLATVEENIHNRYVSKRYDSQNLIAYSAFDECEGFGSPYAASHTFDLQLPGLYTADPAAHLELRLASQNRNDHQLEVSLDGSVIDTRSVGRYQVQALSYDLPGSDVKPEMDLLIQGLNGNTDRYAISEWKVEYRRTFNALGQPELVFHLPPSPQKRLLRFSQLSTSQVPQLWDLTHAQRWQLELDGEDWLVVIPPLLDTTYFYLQGIPAEVVQVNPVDFATELLEEEADFVIITHPQLQQALPGGSQPVLEYAAYRSSAQGGNYQTTIVNIEDLYALFAYGIREHPLAIRHFSQYMVDQWETYQHVLLLGHGMIYPLVRDRDSLALSQHLIPVFGVPGSDNLLFCATGRRAPELSVGRVGARTPEEVRIYLEKIQMYDQQLNAARSLENHAWRKRVLHLVGGNSSELPLFRSYLNNMAEKIRLPFIAASVETIDKEASGAVQQSVSARVVEAVKEGVLFKTFLGHGAVTVTGFGLDDPQFFPEQQHLFTGLSLGCLTGNIFDLQNSVSERFIFSPNRGAIAYLSSSGYGFPNALAAMGGSFYEQLNGAMYGAPMGEVIKKVREIYEDFQPYPFATLVEQLQFHGDPAIRLHLYNGPDYLVDYGSIRWDPNPLYAQQDSFTLQFDLVNIGRIQAEPLEVTVEREFQGQQIASRRDTIFWPSDDHRLTLQTRWPTGGTSLAGRHTFFIQLDADNQIPEMPAPQAEQNNTARSQSGQEGIEVLIQDLNALPVYPANYGIVIRPDPTLLAQTADAFAPLATYYFQIDTTAYFNSPLKQESQLIQSGGILRWRPDINWTDSTVYYWRVAVDSGLTAGSGIAWNQRSFIYLPNASPGWNQSHFFQKRSPNQLKGLELEEPNRTLSYSETLNGVIVESVVGGVSNDTRSRYLINNDRMMKVPPSWGQNLTIAVLDPETGIPWVGPGNRRGFVFRPDDAQSRKAAMDFLTDSIPSGMYVLVMTWHREDLSYVPEEWAQDSVNFGTNLFQVLEAQGATQVRMLEQLGSLPYALAFVKDEGVIGEVISADISQSALLIFDMPVAGREGELISVPIGPARTWGSADWRLSGLVADKDTFRLSLEGGSNPQGPYSTLKAFNSPGEWTDISDVDASQYPYLRWSLFSQDSLDQSATDLAYWRVFYEKPGDVALDAAAGYTFESDTLQQGQPLILKVPVFNIGTADMDSLLVQYTITGTDNQSETYWRTYAPLPVGDSLSIQFTHDTRFLSGDYRLFIELNPGPEQLECNLDNNLGFLSFHVKEDRINPLLDVTFDGQRILDGDLVSANPQILIRLRDENPYLLLEDSTTLSLELTYPEGRTEPIFFSRGDLQFIPPTGALNEALIDWQPRFTEDGEYELRVNGKDASGNESGRIQYRIRFEVITRRSISRFVPYPNPFSTSCRFAYVLTGDAPPDVFKLQIMSVSGKVVREIDQSEFGPLRIGKHLSDYRWDGRDQYGDPLANGVYLYRVIVRNLDDNLEHLETQADQFFKKGFGKLVILR